MNSSTWRKIVILLVFIVGLAYALPSFPTVATSALGSLLPSARINLGLDLKGGISLTLGVETQKAVNNTLLQTGQNIRLEAMDEGLTVLNPRLNADALEFFLPKSEEQTALDTILADTYSELNIDNVEALETGGLRYIVTFDDAFKMTIEAMALDQVVQTLRNRIDQFGVAEPDIRKQADNRIQIQLPGMSDAERAIQLVGQTAQLTFHLVRDDINLDGLLPPEVSRFPMVEDKNNPTETETFILLDRDPLMTGENIADARPGFEQDNSVNVSLTFNNQGAATFERLTGEHIKRRMAIVLDGKVYTAPTIQDRIAGGRASITGNFTTAEAQDLAIVLRAGSLPAPVSILEERTVGPSLGQESINKGITAALIGALAVAVIMPIYYSLAGLVANLMLVFTLILLVAGLAAFGATLTLPGIAGIVLTIGMSVDANVLIFERIREELRRGCSAAEAVVAGFERASISIIDSNLTTIIAAAILYQFGTGPVRGFAVTLSLGILASMFTAIVVSRVLFEQWAQPNNRLAMRI